ncbi:hypothetical protein THAOC_17213 [Thalassiosira oceanica]|uniref:HMG box domain-containing protein n=1 Tax=Thalassiosira oceanica TaxID=159749 RepID=K0SMQ9_THAOC|nr:hypothetical protein THAOC_17213 [Thalassiosira oceanica]|eukprot:EJK62186.1 hypothetical protein THAOC_17213 [Thalassiosira oceanica]
MNNWMSFGTASPSEREDGPADSCGLPVRLAADIRSFLVADDGSFKHEAIETMLAYLLKLKREVTKGSTLDNANDMGKVPLTFIGKAHANVRHPDAVGHRADAAQLMTGGSPNYANVPTHVLRALAASMDGRARYHEPPSPQGLLHEAGLHHRAHRDALYQVAANNAHGVFAARLAAMGEASIASDGKPCEARYEERSTNQVCGEKRKGGVTTDPEDSANSKRMRFDWSDIERYRHAVGAIPPVGLLGNPSIAQEFNQTINWTYGQWANATSSPVETREIGVEAGKNMPTLSADAVEEERANRTALLIKKRSYSNNPRSGAFSNIPVSAAAVDSSLTVGSDNANNGIEDLEQRWFARKLARNGAHANDIVVAASREGKMNAESSLTINTSVASSIAESTVTKAQKRKQKKTPLKSREDAFDPTKNRPLNRFNLFFILERERLLMQMNDQGDNPAEKATEKASELPPGIATGYEGLKMPELPPRFKDLTLPDDWFVPGKRKLVKRRHRKSHGVMGFKKMAQELAASWRSIDEVTLKYCTDCAKIIADRYTEITQQQTTPLTDPPESDEETSSDATA